MKVCCPTGGGVDANQINPGPGAAEARSAARKNDPCHRIFVHRTREWVQIIISVVLLIASLFVVLSPKYGPKDKHWAYGTIGTLVGFWLRQ
jgi:hypothetical protein